MSSSVESCRSSGTTSATAVNLKACSPLITYVTFLRNEPGSAHEKTTSKPAHEPAGMTCEAGVGLG